MIIWLILAVVITEGLTEFSFSASASFLIKSSGSFIRCCPSVWSSLVGLPLSSFPSPFMVFNTSPSAGISLTSLKQWRRAAASLLLVSNLAAGLYTGLVHQRGTLDAMSHLRALCDGNSMSSPPLPDVLFLMPCHSTPFYRYSSWTCCGCRVPTCYMLLNVNELPSNGRVRIFTGDKPLAFISLFWKVDIGKFVHILQMRQYEII